MPAVYSNQPVARWSKNHIRAKPSPELCSIIKKQFVSGHVGVCVCALCIFFRFYSAFRTCFRVNYSATFRHRSEISRRSVCPYLVLPSANVYVCRVQQRMRSFSTGFDGICFVSLPMLFQSVVYEFLNIAAIVDWPCFPRRRSLPSHPPISPGSATVPIVSR